METGAEVVKLSLILLLSNNKNNCARFCASKLEAECRSRDWGNEWEGTTTTTTQRTQNRALKLLTKQSFVSRNQLLARTHPVKRSSAFDTQIACVRSLQSLACIAAWRKRERTGKAE